MNKIIKTIDNFFDQLESKIGSEKINFIKNILLFDIDITMKEYEKNDILTNASHFPVVPIKKKNIYENFPTDFLCNDVIKEIHNISNAMYGLRESPSKDFFYLKEFFVYFYENKISDNYSFNLPEKLDDYIATKIMYILSKYCYVLSYSENKDIFEKVANIVTDIFNYHTYSYNNLFSFSSCVDNRILPAVVYPVNNLYYISNNNLSLDIFKYTIESILKRFGFSTASVSKLISDLNHLEIIVKMYIKLLLPISSSLAYIYYDTKTDKLLNLVSKYLQLLNELNYTQDGINLNKKFLIDALNISICKIKGRIIKDKNKHPNRREKKYITTKEIYYKTLGLCKTDNLIDEFIL